jgi:hypothetical protein
MTLLQFNQDTRFEVNQGVVSALAASASSAERYVGGSVLLVVIAS